MGTEGGFGSEVAVRRGRGEGMRAEVGREELARGECPAFPAAMAPRPGSTKHPFLTPGPRPARSLLTERAAPLCCGQLSFSQGQLYLGELYRPSAPQWVARFGTSVSLGIEKEDADSSDFPSKVAMAKPGQDKNECLRAYYVPGPVDTSFHDL